MATTVVTNTNKLESQEIKNNQQKIYEENARYCATAISQIEYQINHQVDLKLSATDIEELKKLKHTFKEKLHTILSKAGLHTITSSQSSDEIANTIQTQGFFKAAESFSPSLPKDRIESLELDLTRLKELSQKIKEKANPTECKSYYDFLSEDKKNQLAYYIWIAHGTNRDPHYGKKILNEAENLGEVFDSIQKPYICQGKGSLLDQFIYSMELQLELEKANYEYSHTKNLTSLEKSKKLIEEIKKYQTESFLALYSDKNSATHKQLLHLYKSPYISQETRISLPPPPYYGRGIKTDLHKTFGAHPTWHGSTEFRVYAPNAKHVKVVLTAYGEKQHFIDMQKGPEGIWYCEAKWVGEGRTYFYEIETKDGKKIERADPFAVNSIPQDNPFRHESVVRDLGKYQWNDAVWMKERKNKKFCNIYENYPTFWKRPNGRPMSYVELADENNPESLLSYCKKMGYTHVQMMGILEHPQDQSWGYQVTGLFAPTSRLGTPQEFKLLVDKFHQHGIGVILDWVPAHFAVDEFGLGNFDGTALYEHSNPLRGKHPEWGTYNFDFEKEYVRNFLYSSAKFWLEEMHIDGLRVDAVASMLYHNYARKGGFLPNHKGGATNLEALLFFRELNTMVKECFPGVHVIAEESSGFNNLTADPQNKFLSGRGVGFTSKQSIGGQHDILFDYLYTPFEERKARHPIATKAISAVDGNEKTVMLFSHDEFSQGKGTLFSKMQGDIWRKFAGIRAATGFLMTRPGHKSNFMGNEIGQKTEWSWRHLLAIGKAKNHRHDCEKKNDDECPYYPAEPQLSSVEWEALKGEQGMYHQGVQKMVQDLNRVYLNNPALWGDDETSLKWIDGNDENNQAISFHRRDETTGQQVAVVHNFSPQAIENYEIILPDPSYAPELDKLVEVREIFNSDKREYGGSGVENSHVEIIRDLKGRAIKLRIRLAPLATMIFSERFS